MGSTRNVSNLDPDEQLWVQVLGPNLFEVGVQLNKQQYTYLELNNAQLQELSNNIIAAQLEAEVAF